MLDSTVLRKRGGASSPTQHVAKISPTYRSHSDVVCSASRGSSGDVRRHFPFILKVVTAAVIIMLLGKMFVSTPFRRRKPTPRNLGAADMLSTVPLGFSIDLPTNLGALEIYLDSRPLRSIDAVDAVHSTKKSTDVDDGGDEPTKIQHFFGTCDIKDHGENDTRKHAFSLGDAGMDSMDSSIYLKPGEHIIEVYHRGEHNKLSPYAHMIVNVDAPPELLLGSSPSFFRKSSYETAYNLALSEIGNNIACNHFVAGTGWSQLWTRDTSYAAELGAALLHPAVVKQSLMASVGKWRNDKEVWLQDTCGHFGGWPNLSDAIVGVRGAWSLYLVTGDKE